MKMREPAPLPVKPATGECAKPARKKSMPRMEGVAGEVLVAPLDLQWGRPRKASPYYDILVSLRDRTEAWLKQPDPAVRPAVRFEGPQARQAVTVQARKLNLRVTFAERDSFLWVRMDGFLDEDLRTQRRTRILEILSRHGNGLRTTELSARVRETGDPSLNASDLDAILRQMVRDGAVVAQEGGSWKKK